MAKVEAKSVAFIAGPTASGKSALAVAVAGALDGTIINADSMQVYHDLATLTARPQVADLARAPHRLYGVVDGAERCSAALWAEMAKAAIDEAHAAGRLPILVGGTGLYFRALEMGLSPIPTVPEDVRARLRMQLAAQGAAVLHAELAARDPEAARRLKPGDSQRIVRALEVLEATGRPLASFQTPPAGGLGSRGDLAIHRLVVAPVRPLLYQRINMRAVAMVEQGGAVAEVRQLLERQLDPDLPVMKALGVKELSAFIEGTCSLAEAISMLQRNTRHYAKRQMTWVRHQCADWHWVGEEFSAKHMKKIFS